jgi:hypothetical protein
MQEPSSMDNQANHAAEPEAKDRWIPGTEDLHFGLGGRTLVNLSLSALILDAPFASLSGNLEDIVLPWSEFPGGVEVAVIPAHPIREKPARLKFLPRWIRYATTSVRYSIDLRCTFPKYLSKLGPGTRRDVKTSVRKFAELSGGQIKWQAFSTPGEVNDFYNLASEISHHSWNERIGGPGFSGTIAKERIEVLAGEDRFRGYVLFYEGRAVAFGYCEIHRGTVGYIKSGYDEKYGKHSPGSVLYCLFLESLFAEKKYICFDFGNGEQSHKSKLSTEATECAYAMYFPRNVRNVSILLTKTALEQVSMTAGKLLQFAGIKNRLKRVMKGKLARGPVEAG